MRTVAIAILGRGEALRSAADRVNGVYPAFDLDESFADIGPEDLEALEEANPEIVFVELSDDPDLGLRLARFLAECSPARPVAIVGREPSADVLLTALRAGIAEFLRSPVDEEELAAAVARLSGRLDRPAEPAGTHGRVLGVVAAKGGVGSTLAAVNLATQLQRQTRGRVLLVDLDLELGDSAVLFGLEPRYDAVDVVRNLHRMDGGLLASYVETHESGVQVLAAPGSPSKADDVTPEHVRELLQFVRRHYDHVVVDLSSRYGLRGIAALREADDVLVVSTPDLPALRNAKRLMPLLLSGGDEGGQRVRLVLNRHEAAFSVPADELERILGVPVLGTVANDYEAVTRSINEGRPLVLERGGAAATDLKRIGSLLAGVDPVGRRGIANSLRRLVRRKAA